MIKGKKMLLSPKPDEVKSDKLVYVFALTEEK